MSRLWWILDGSTMKLCLELRCFTSDRLSYSLSMRSDIFSYIVRYFFCLLSCLLFSKLFWMYWSIVIMLFEAEVDGSGFWLSTVLLWFRMALPVSCHWCQYWFFCPSLILEIDGRSVLLNSINWFCLYYNLFSESWLCLFDPMRLMDCRLCLFTP